MGKHEAVGVAAPALSPRPASPPDTHTFARECIARSTSLRGTRDLSSSALAADAGLQSQQRLPLHHR
jgi:hypothetical protein